MKTPVRKARNAARNVGRAWAKFGASLCLAGVAVACANLPSPLESPRHRRDLRIGISPMLSPLAFRVGSELRGIEPDLARLAASDLKLRPDFVELARDALIPSLESGEVDVVVSALPLSHEQNQRVLFTHPYLQVGQRALIRSRDRAIFGRPDSIQGLGARVGILRGEDAENIAEGKIQRAEIYVFDRADEGIRSLRAQRVDFMILDAPTAWNLTSAREAGDLLALPQPLTEESVAWAVALHNADLRDELDQILDRWRATNRLEEVLTHWLPERAQPWP